MNAPEIDTPPVITAAQGLFLILNAATLRRMPMPFAAVAYDYSPVVDFQFRHRVDLVTWATALEVAEVVDTTVDDGRRVQTLFEAKWLDVSIRCISSVPREPR